ncbi:MAG: hypothetical protein V1901_03880 [Patescibacteria group bacterium]
MYKIIFEDNTEFIGEDLQNSKWNEMPNKKIKKIEYSLLGKIVILENYEAYNHLIEHSIFILANQKPRINRILLMAKKDNRVYIFIFNLLNKELYIEKTCDFGKEYHGGSTIGWKQGLQSEIIKYNII